MKHTLSDTLIPGHRAVPRDAIERVIEECERLERQALNGRVSKADGREMPIPWEFGLGRSGGFHKAADLLRAVLGDRS
jgi:hypothetical protein